MRACTRRPWRSRTESGWSGLSEFVLADPARGLWLINTPRFAEAGKLDSDETWLQLCAGSHDAVNIFESFLEMYILNSETSVPCLGPDEYKTKRDVNSAATLQDVWSALVRVANDDVLKQFRYQPNANAQHFTLRYSTRGGVESGPAGLVGKVRLTRCGCC